MIKYFDISQKNGYRKKLQLLLWSVLPLFLLCYLLAFKKTLNTINAYNNNRMAALQSSRKLDSLSVYEKKSDEIGSWKKQYILDSTVMDANIVAALNVHCDDLGLNFKEYKPLGISNQHVWTRIVTVAGDYKAMLKLVFNLEQENRICRVASVNFKKVKDNSSGKEDLNCTFYIQNVIK
ncbi:MAG: hypothetical protein QM640_03200 [Niabella sp.]